MSNLTILELDNAEIRQTEDGWFSVYDFLKLVTSHKNPRVLWKRLKEQYPEFLHRCENCQFPGKGQKSTPVTDRQGLLEILEAYAAVSRTFQAKEIARQLGTNSRRFPIETDYLEVISSSFKHLNPVSQFFVSGYRIDLYFPSERLAIECDELEHKYRRKADKQRQETIEKILGCRFIRFEPQSKDFRIGDLINEIMIAIYG